MNKELKLVFTSDLHYTSSYKKVIEDSFKKLKKNVDPDIIILGGDISEEHNGFEEVLHIIREIFGYEIHIGLVPGNHDLWYINWVNPMLAFREEIEFNNFSNYLLKTKIPKVCDQFGVTYLEKNYIKVGKWGLHGTIGWYDYSYKYEQENFPDEYYELNKKRFNNDANYVKLPLSDREFSANRLRSLKRRINKDKSENKIVFTHVPTFKEFVVCKAHERDGVFWNIGSSYFYNLTLGNYFKTIKELRAVISGHTHIEKQFNIKNKFNKDLLCLTSNSDRFEENISYRTFEVNFYLFKLKNNGIIERISYEG